LSPGDSRREIQEKIQTYLDTGVESVWIIQLKRREVRVHRRNRDVQIFAETTELTDELLPGFRFPVVKIFDPRK